MLTELRAYFRQQTLGLRETARDLYDHYRQERDRIEDEALRTEDDRRILAAIARAQDEQHQHVIERQVRHLYEQSRFVRRRDDDAA